MTTRQEEASPPYKSIELRLVTPEFESDLMDLILHFEFLRKMRVGGTTPASVFFQIKEIFHILESVGSARIEGNRTSVVEFIDKKLEASAAPVADSIKEIENMGKALRFIDDNVRERPINRAFISELHKMVVEGLTEEGSKRPGEYRNVPVKLRNSFFIPPPFVSIQSLMDELFDFIARGDAPKYDLLKIALAHHRFVWIHPFDNGNGRTVRLLTYAMLVKFGFNVHLARVLNPTAVFCHDRAQYYASLSRADVGDDAGFLAWTLYMLAGLKRELEKTDKLADYEYLKREILYPAIEFSLERNILNTNEAKILRLSVEKKEITNSDIKTVFPTKDKSSISHMIKRLLDKRFLKSIENNKRKYCISFGENKLIRGVMFALDKAGFLPSNS